MDRPLGALRRVALTAAALTLTVLSTAAAAPEDDDPGPALAGTPVTGTRDGTKAPVLTTGRYLDHLPARGRLNYRLPRTATGSTFHLSVMFVGVGDSVGEGIRTEVGTTPGDQGCGSGGVFRPTLGETDPVLFTSTTTWTDDDDHACAVAPDLYLSIGSPDDVKDAGREVEILVYEEPPLSDYAIGLLPEPTPPTWTALRPATRPRTVPVGTTPTNAPVVADGSYALSLRPGRTSVFAVPLDWDQSLQVQLDARLPAGAPVPDRVAVDVVSPMLGTGEVSFATRRPADWRTPGEDGGRLRLGAQSQVVSYINRDSYDAGVNTEALAGVHYVLVRWTGTDQPGTDPDLSVRATLTLRTTGTAGDGVPSYTPVEGLIGPQAPSRLVDGTLQAPPPEEPDDEPAPDDGTSPDRRTLAAVAVATALVLAGLVLRGARRRRRTHPHAGSGRPLGHHDPGGRHRG